MDTVINYNQIYSERSSDMSTPMPSAPAETPIVDPDAANKPAVVPDDWYQRFDERITALEGEVFGVIGGLTPAEPMPLTTHGGA